MRVMAIDYGDAHTGIAVSDPTGLLAGFTATIDAYHPEAAADRIAALAAEHGAEELVLGHPVNMDGTLSLNEAHSKATVAEKAIKHRFGENAIVTIHMEPTKK